MPMREDDQWPLRPEAGAAAFEDDYDQKPDDEGEVAALGAEVYNTGAVNALTATLGYIDANPRTVEDIRAFVETALKAVTKGDT